MFPDRLFTEPKEEAEVVQCLKLFDVVEGLKTSHSSQALQCLADMVDLAEGADAESLGDWARTSGVLKEVVRLSARFDETEPLTHLLAQLVRDAEYVTLQLLHPVLVV